LREFAEGSSDLPFQPLIEVNMGFEGGKYQIDIRRSRTTDQLLVIAKSELIDGVNLAPAPGFEAMSGPLRDFFPGTELAIGADLMADMPTIKVGASPESDASMVDSIYVVRLNFENQTGFPIGLAIVVANEDGLIYRLDTIAVSWGM